MSESVVETSEKVGGVPTGGRLTAEARKRSILRAARRAFSETGDVKGTTMRAIAERGGISEAIIYRHFASKDQLFFEAVVAPLEEAVDELVASAKVVDRDQPLTPERQRQTLEDLYRQLSSTLEEVLPLLGLVLFGDPKVAQRFYRENLTPAMDRLANAWREVEDRHGYESESMEVPVRAVMGIALVLALESHHSVGFDRDRAFNLVSEGTLNGFFPGEVVDEGGPGPRELRATMRRELFDEEHELFRSSVRRFVREEVLPHEARWEADGIVDRSLFTKAGAAGLLGFAAPVEYGGGGVRDFRYNLVLGEEMQAQGLAAVGIGVALHTDIAMPYFLDLANDEQKRRWLPGICSGELITAVAMTEPSAGSDLAGIKATAIRDGDVYVVNGSKTFITNGINADLIVTAVKTDPAQRHAGMSLIMLERGMEGFERGRNLDKMGMHAQDTAELFFDDVRVPVQNLLGTEGGGFGHLVHNLPQERLSLALAACGGAKMAFDTTVAYCRERMAFGQSIGAFQNSRFRLADIATELALGETFVDRCVLALNRGELTAEEAAMVKLWCTELQARAVDLGVQLHGGYGYMSEFPIAKAYVDARITRIYGGTSEVMREIIGRSLGL